MQGHAGEIKGLVKALGPSGAAEADGAGSTP
jgi:hypothetical protein